ncbi:hypothetical protein D3C84_836030 [compost metagenome]
MEPVVSTTSIRSTSSEGFVASSILISITRPCFNSTFSNCLCCWPADTFKLYLALPPCSMNRYGNKYAVPDAFVRAVQPFWPLPRLNVTTASATGLPAPVTCTSSLRKSWNFQYGIYSPPSRDCIRSFHRLHSSLSSHSPAVRIPASGPFPLLPGSSEAPSVSIPLLVSSRELLSAFGSSAAAAAPSSVVVDSAATAESLAAELSWRSALSDLAAEE